MGELENVKRKSMRKQISITIICFIGFGLFIKIVFPLLDFQLNKFSIFLFFILNCFFSFETF